jgi:photosystem II stability/assembly factor-like uncharacterized protein
MNDRAWLATRKGLIELRRRAGRWAVEQVSFLGEPVTMVLPSDPGSQNMLACLSTGHYGTKVHASSDAGSSWAEIDAPAYPEQPADAKGPPWKLVQIWSIEQAHGIVWAGTLPGGLFRSDDFGRTWALQRSLWDRPERLEWFGGGYDVPGIHSICPHPGDANDLLLGISCGGAWRSTDGGQRWALAAKGMKADFMPPEQADSENIQDPHRIVRSPAAPELLWCQHHGGIWKSQNNAASWQRVENVPVSDFGFAVAAHPTQADTAWFAPAAADQQRVPKGGALVVNRTRDGGKSFETLREGLPQEDCYDLVYRHGLAVSADGDHLLMASTTGGLWASSDGGDRWSTVSNLLPPIYAVRLG